MGEYRQGGRVDIRPLKHRGAEPPRPCAVSRATQTDLERSFTPPFNPFSLSTYEGPMEREDGKTPEYIYLPIGAFAYSGPPSDPDRRILGKIDVKSINGIVVDEVVTDADTKALAQRVVSTAYGENGQVKKVAYWIDRTPDGSIYGVPKSPRLDS